MTDTHHQDTQQSDELVAFRVLPRKVQASVGLLLVVATVLGVVFFERDNSAAITNPGATLPKVGQRLVVPLTNGNGGPTLTDIDGRPFDASSLVGHPVWINIWASWCAPCRVEMPDLEAMYTQEKVAHPDLILLSLNTADTRDNGLAFFRELHLTSQLVFNDGSRDIGQYRVQNFPSHILVDRNGIVRQVLQQSMDRPTAEREIQVILR